MPRSNPSSVECCADNRLFRAYFAWKAFSQWQARQEGSEEDKLKKEEMHQYLKDFRETFSRPVRRIRFMGLFDTGKFPRSAGLAGVATS